MFGSLGGTSLSYREEVGGRVRRADWQLDERDLCARVRVVIDKQILMEHCCVIAILGQDGEVFRYLDPDTMEGHFSLT